VSDVFLQFSINLLQWNCDIILSDTLLNLMQSIKQWHIYGCQK